MQSIAPARTRAAAKHPERFHCWASFERATRMLSPGCWCIFAPRPALLCPPPSLPCCYVWKQEESRAVCLWSEGMSRRWLLQTRAVPVQRVHAGVCGTAVYPPAFPLPRSCSRKKKKKNHTCCFFLFHSRFPIWLLLGPVATNPSGGTGSVLPASLPKSCLNSTCIPACILPAAPAAANPPRSSARPLPTRV